MLFLFYKKNIIIIFFLDSDCAADLCVCAFIMDGFFSNLKDMSLENVERQIYRRNSNISTYKKRMTENGKNTPIHRRTFKYHR